MKEEVESIMYTGNTYEEPMIEYVEVGECNTCKVDIHFHESYIHDVFNQLMFCSEKCMYEYEESDQ